MMDEGQNNRCPECGLILYQEVSQCPRCLAPISAASAQPIVEQVYISDRPPKEKKNVKRTATIILVIAVVAILIITMSYQFIIPRLDLKVITVYRESSGLSINVDSKIKNEGTLSLKDFSMNITILNESGGVVARGEHYISSVDAHSEEKFDNIQFYGDQVDPYTINIEIDFESSGRSYSETFRHSSDKYMLMRFEDGISQWGG